jgi:hypothetical protein
MRHGASKPHRSAEVESPGKSMVTRTASYPGWLALAVARVLGHTGPVEEWGRRLRGRCVWAGRSRMWEATRQARCIRPGRVNIAAALETSIDEFAGPVAQSDDIAILVAKRLSE